MRISVAMVESPSRRLHFVKKVEPFGHNMIIKIEKAPESVLLITRTLIRPHTNELAHPRGTIGPLDATRLVANKLRAARTFTSRGNFRRHIYTTDGCRCGQTPSGEWHIQRNISGFTYRGRDGNEEENEWPHPPIGRLMWCVRSSVAFSYVG